MGWITLLTPIVVTSSPPALPPYNNYIVHGSIQRAGGGSLDGFAIALMYKRVAYEYPSEWLRVGTVDLTDLQGRFQVQSTPLYYEEVDSLVLTVVSPDTVLMGAPFPASEAEPYKVESMHTHTDDGFFCDDVESSWEVDGYEHYYSNKVLPVP